MNLINITKAYGEKTVFKDFNLDISPNEITAVLGESGSGKTTLLNIIAGLTDYSGQIIGGVKPAAFVFREDRLVPSLTAGENVLLVNKKADVKALFTLAGLRGRENSYPKTLSAGMARRVAILRAFAFESPLILMDEPFTNLDIGLKFSLIEYFKAMQKEYNRTAIVVTHDVKEAVAIADRVVVIGDGRVVYDNQNVTDKSEGEIFELMLKIGKKE